ncbi:MAG TPA: acyl-CoA thioester hydrolase/BAAT C-terminal domain-containing protein [Pyrinomonadaceae bacterium]|nr:acyl-CoA thioester hydrolase/BAAT C-terminal domain-containing protein [Pyrinomonadaceae bacterium]
MVMRLTGIDIKTIFPALVFAFVLTGHAQTKSDASVSRFAYNQNSPLSVKEISVEKRGDVIVRDVTFVPSPGGREVKAYVVVPAGNGPFAGILWVHWLGEEKSNRTQFLEEAVELAPKGVVSVLVDAMWSEPRWFGSRIPEQDYENSIRQVIELRRALDLLLSQPQVDKARVGYVGHDFGAMYGMLMAGVEKRVKTYVFIAATQSLNDWAFLGPQPKSKAAYLKQNAGLELTDYLRQSTNASKFFQFGKADFYISQADAAVVFAAAGQPKQRKMYDASHKMELKEIMVDRDEWLMKELISKQ